MYKTAILKRDLILYRKMGRIIGMFLLVMAMLPAYVSGQTENHKPARILFLVDASSSMTSEWIGKESRFQAASRVINALVDSIHRVNTDVAFAVRVFGNQYPSQDKNCYDTKLEVPFNLGNDAQIKARLSYLKPLGYSPIAWSLKETAEKDFTESSNYSYSIILITDGGESCGGDICATVKTLLEKKISFKPYILSLVDYEPLRLQYECLGKYLTVAKEKDIEPVIKTIINDNRKILTIKSSGLKTIATTTKPVGTTISKPVIPEIKPEPVVVKKEEPKPVVKKEEPKPIVKSEPVVVKKEEPKP
ncbi:MAG: VWA domain-containing protein, partial [Sphingobacteriales bacterium]